MRRHTRILLATILFLTAASVPSGAARADEPANNRAVYLVRDIMALDYEAMSVMAFNMTIQVMCADADTTLYAVISDVYTNSVVSDEAGNFERIEINAPGIEAFLRTTLAYSSQEILADPVYQRSALYIMTDALDANALYAKQQSMPPTSWQRYYQSILGDIRLTAYLTYEITADILDGEALSVGERDRRLNTLQDTVWVYLLAQSPEAILSEAMEDDLAAKLSALSIDHSDGLMRIQCRLVAFEKITQ